MNMISTGAFQTEMGASNKQTTLAEKFVTVWEKKNSQAARAGGVSLMALSLAACGSDTAVTPTVVVATPTTDTTPAVDPVASQTLTSGLDIKDAGNDNVFAGEATLTSGDRVETTGYVELDLSNINIDGQTILANEVKIDASGGVTVEASDWTTSTVSVKDSTGNVTVNDLQSAATLLQVIDVVDVAATVTFNFDAQAVAGTADNIALTVDEVTAAITLSGGNTETVTMTIADGTGEASTLAAFAAAGITTLKINGGVAAQDFRIESDLPTGITTLDASGATGDVHAEAAASTTTLDADFAKGADSLNMGNTYDSTDNLAGGEGADMAAMQFSTATVREGTMSGFETLNAIFTAEATFDATNVTGLTTINLGDDYNGVDTASTADADFNDMKAETKTLNVEATQIDVEMDYAEVGDLTMNLNTADAALTIGDAAGDDIQLLDVGTLAINVNGDNAATIQDMTDLHDDTTSLTITTDTVNGNLFMGNATVAETAVDGGSKLKTVTIAAVNGDMMLFADDNGTITAGNEAFIDEAEALQTYSVSTDDADVRIGYLGRNDFGSDAALASELERLTFDTTQDGSIDQGYIAADDETGANIESLTISTNDKNTVTQNATTFTYGGANLAAGNANVVIRGLDAQQIDNITLNALDDGNIALDNQSYQVDTMTFTGNGDIAIHAATSNVTSAAYTQASAATATAHTGARTFDDGIAADTFYGSTGADTINFTTADGDKDYYVDAGGTDTINSNDANEFDMINLSHASDNTVNATTEANILVNSTGTQTINDLGANTMDVWVTGANSIAGGNTVAEVALTGFDTTSDDISFDALGLLSTTNTTQNIAMETQAAKFVINDDAVVTIEGVFVNDGNAANDFSAATGSIITGGTQLITDPTGSATNHTDVASYLSEGLTVSAGSTNVFVINTTAGAADGDGDLALGGEHVYYWNDADGGADIDASELDLIMTSDANIAGATDIINVTDATFLA